MNPNKLFERINLGVPFERYMEDIEKEYPNIGTIQKYSPIQEGYEDANFFLSTSNGKYVLKIFSKDRTEKNIKDYIKIIQEARKIGVQTLEIIPNNKNSFYLFNGSYSIITSFFEGKSFKFIKPSLDEIALVTENISRLNTLNFDVEESYDSWGSKNLVTEHDKSKVQNELVRREILPLVEFLKQQDYSQFSKGIIHGDMQRQHVLKNEKNICIIDYGCARRDFKIYEVSVFLAWFCLAQDSWDEREKILKEVIEKYTEVNNLTTGEIDNIKPLIAASYAAYYLKTTELIENGDHSQETTDWNNSSRQMFEKCMDWVRV